MGHPSDSAVLCVLLPVLGAGGTEHAGASFLVLLVWKEETPLGLVEDLALTMCGRVDRALPWLPEVCVPDCRCSVEPVR